MDVLKVSVHKLLTWSLDANEFDQLWEDSLGPILSQRQYQKDTGEGAGTSGMSSQGNNDHRRMLPQGVDLQFEWVEAKAFIKEVAGSLFKAEVTSQEEMASFMLHRSVCRATGSTMGAGDGVVSGGGVVFGVMRSSLGENPGDAKGMVGGESRGVKGGATCRIPHKGIRPSIMKGSGHLYNRKKVKIMKDLESLHVRNMSFTGEGIRIPDGRILWIQRPLVRGKQSEYEFLKYTPRKRIITTRVVRLVTLAFGLFGGDIYRGT
ncbi:hypothetical protein Tco_0173010 [Tanacetum coccineum]